MSTPAYINALAEEGSRKDLISWLIQLDRELRDAQEEIALMHQQLKTVYGDLNVAELRLAAALRQIEERS